MKTENQKSWSDCPCKRNTLLWVTWANWELGILSSECWLNRPFSWDVKRGKPDVTRSLIRLWYLEQPVLSYSLLRLSTSAVAEIKIESICLMTRFNLTIVKVYKRVHSIFIYLPSLNVINIKYISISAGRKLSNITNMAGKHDAYYHRHAFPSSNNRVIWKQAIDSQHNSLWNVKSRWIYLQRKAIVN